jgi:hypothetical protein
VVKKMKKINYTPVKFQRSNPDAVLSFTSGANEANFFSLGFKEDREGEQYIGVNNGWIEVEFEHPVLNGSGVDLRIIEDTWGLPYPTESAAVYVKAEASDDWKMLGTANNQTPVLLGYHTYSDFDLEGVVEYARFIKVQDTSVRSHFASRYPAQKDTLDGFDLNAIESLQDNQSCDVTSETAWAATKPGETRFSLKGNWATYFTYTLSPSWELIETVLVPATSIAGISSNSTLESGKTYKLEASGTYKFANWTGYGYADAEYSHRAEGYRDPAIFECTSDFWCTRKDEGPGLDVQVNGPVNWGPYQADHVYEMLFPGTNSTVHFHIYDDQYNDNVGGITVKIYEKMF